MPAPYDVFLLDLDHTLFDTGRSESLAFDATLRAAGAADPAKYFATYNGINKALWAAVERQETTPTELRTQRFVDLAKATDLDADPLRMAEDFTDGLGAFGELYPGARPVLDRLAASARLALITNGLSDVQRSRIERLGIGDYFEAVVISAEVGLAKPGVEIFEHTFRMLNSPPKDTAIMVGDSLTSDIAGGSNFGVDTCWYNAHGAMRGSADTVTIEISALTELLDLCG